MNGLEMSASTPTKLEPLMEMETRYERSPTQASDR